MLLDYLSSPYTNGRQVSGHCGIAGQALQRLAHAGSIILLKALHTWEQACNTLFRRCPSLHRVIQTRPVRLMVPARAC